MFRHAVCDIHSSNSSSCDTSVSAIELVGRQEEQPAVNIVAFKNSCFLGTHFIDASTRKHCSNYWGGEGGEISPALPIVVPGAITRGGATIGAGGVLHPRLFQISGGGGCREFPRHYLLSCTPHFSNVRVFTALTPPAPPPNSWRRAYLL